MRNKWKGTGMGNGVEGDRGEGEVEGVTTHECGKGGNGAGDWELTDERGDGEGLDGVGLSHRDRPCRSETPRELEIKL